MATTFKNEIIKDIGLAPITVLVAGVTSQLTIIGMSLSNLTEYPININVTVSDDSSVEAFYLKEVVVPPNSSLRAVAAGEKLTLPPAYSLNIWADEDESIDAVISYVEIT